MTEQDTIATPLAAGVWRARPADKDIRKALAAADTFRASIIAAMAVPVPQNPFEGASTRLPARFRAAIHGLDRVRLTLAGRLGIEVGCLPMPRTTGQPFARYPAADLQQVLALYEAMRVGDTGFLKAMPPVFRVTVVDQRWRRRLDTDLGIEMSDIRYELARQYGITVKEAVCWPKPAV